LLSAALRKELRPSLAVHRPSRFCGLPLLAAHFHDALGVHGRSEGDEPQAEESSTAESGEQVSHLIFPPRRSAQLAR
jgi:hypothetical protein